MDETRANAEEYDARKLLRQLALFRHLDDAELTALAAELEWFAMPGGATLFDYGDPSDALYILQSGSLGAFKPDQHGKFNLEGVVAAGETVGELGLMVDQPRSATVRALRDSELLRLSRAGFKTLIASNPEAMLEAARVSVKRLLTRHTTTQLSSPRTFAILPHDDSVDAVGFARQWRDRLHAPGARQRTPIRRPHRERSRCRGRNARARGAAPVRSGRWPHPRFRFRLRHAQAQSRCGRFWRLYGIIGAWQLNRNSCTSSSCALSA